VPFGLTPITSPYQDHQLDDIYDNMTYEQQLRAAIRISKQEERQREGKEASDEKAQRHRARLASHHNMITLIWLIDNTYRMTLLMWYSM